MKCCFFYLVETVQTNYNLYILGLTTKYRSSLLSFVCKSCNNLLGSETSSSSQINGCHIAF